MAHHRAWIDLQNLTWIDQNNLVQDPCKVYRPNKFDLDQSK